MPCAALKAADLELKAACQDALEELTLSAMSLSEDLPHRWAKRFSGSRVYMQGGGRRVLSNDSHRDASSDNGDR